MWKLKRVCAKNICAFKELDYNLLQGATTLIFGHNLDDDSQGSNGSGKSAMLEVISIGLTGDTLRKVKMDEIINDLADDAYISLEVFNNQTEETMVIERELSRKSPQSIKVKTRNANDEFVDVAQAGVAEYNKYILEKIGLQKDDIFANFILSKHKFSSFLISSDRDKKDIINRFSNGIMVDESIAALRDDMLPVQDETLKAENEVSNVEGRISALKEQIDIAEKEAINRSEWRKNKVVELKNKIVENRAEIRKLNEGINTFVKQLDDIDEVDELLRHMENGDKSVSECFGKIREKFGLVGLECPKDYGNEVEKCHEELQQVSESYQAAKELMDSAQVAYSKSKSDYESLQKESDNIKVGLDSQEKSVNEEINTLLNDIKREEASKEQTNKWLADAQVKIADMQKQLAGVIVCPNCHYEFTFGGDIDIDKTRENLSRLQGQAEKAKRAIEEKDSLILEYTGKGKKCREVQRDIDDKRSSLLRKLQDARNNVDSCQVTVMNLNDQLRGLKERIDSVQKSIDNARKNLFDEAFDIIDQTYLNIQRETKKLEVDIDNRKLSISSYENGINEIEQTKDSDSVDEVISRRDELNRQLNDFKIQEATFVEFKTHLANSKIEAINHMTNEFLEAIGSDIRISLSGYTILKSGKIRDKISVSLLRDGIDCGSFDKFSEGEKARVSLANILAMHKLTNLNCDDEKGLDLLVLDEILDATDEQGLANIFEALNQLKITSLVVSHGRIAENYPYKLVVSKQNGVSYIDE